MKSNRDTQRAIFCRIRFWQHPLVSPTPE